MECPKCHSEFKKIVYEGIEVERCTKCEGIWFDALEHKDLKTKKGSASIDTGDPKRVRNTIKSIKLIVPNVKPR